MRLEWSANDTVVQKALDKMTAAQLRPILRAGTRKGIIEVRKQVVANYKKAFPGSQKWRAIWAKNYAKKNKIGAYISLHKLNPKYDIGNPRLLRWLDLGTYERETKKGYNRGMMNDTGFFGKAVEAKMNQAEAVASKYINEGILKKAKKLGLT
jgi:hypothetical protein